MNETLLTIAIPTFNRADKLLRALQSISSQYDRRVEVVVSDNASSDNTEQVVNEMKKEIPIHYTKNAENIGGDANFLQCYNLAKGEFILLLGDDDLIVEDRLRDILDYLECNGTVDWVFINHLYFSGKYKGKNKYIKLWSDDITSEIDVPKERFLQHCSHRLTFMSCLILSKEAFKRVESPERFIGTYFVHTCVSFMATKSSDAVLGIIGIPCIANDIEDECDFENGAILKYNYKIFGRGMEYTLCTVGSDCGYDHKILKSIWMNFVGGWFVYIIRLKAEYGDYMKEQFYEYGYSVIKKYPGLYFKIMTAVLMPRFCACFLWYRVRPLIKKIRNH